MEERQKSPSSGQREIAFVACSKSKKSYPCQARYLYTGALFKKALKYAERHYDEVYILSAKHGIIHPSEVIEPYNITLNNLNKKELERWYEMINKQVEEKDLNGSFTFFTGRLYNAPFDGKKPLDGLSLGYQLQWFNNKLNLKGLF